MNPRHSVPQTDALPAELLPPLVDCKQFTLLSLCGKVGSNGSITSILLPTKEAATMAPAVGPSRFKVEIERFVV